MGGERTLRSIMVKTPVSSRADQLVPINWSVLLIDTIYTQILIVAGKLCGFQCGADTRLAEIAVAGDR